MGKFDTFGQNTKYIIRGCIYIWLVKILTPLSPSQTRSLLYSFFILFERGKRVKRGGKAPSLLVSLFQPENPLICSIKRLERGQR
jgi:hypothetical protein